MQVLSRHCLHKKFVRIRNLSVCIFHEERDECEHGSKLTFLSGALDLPTSNIGKRITLPR